MDDQRAGWKRGAGRDPAPSLDSPASSTGAGSARLPGPLGDPPASSALHPDAPAARWLDWDGVPRERFGADPAGTLAGAAAAIENILKAQSERIRQVLPAATLQAVYDQHAAQMRVRFRHATRDDGSGHENLLRRLHESIWWIDTRQFATLEGAGLARTGAFRHNAPPGDEERAFLREFTALVEQTCSMALARLQERWNEASGQGIRQQEALVLEWTRRIEYRLEGRPTGTGERLTRPGDVLTPSRRPDLVEPPATPTKTWVEFQLIDEDDRPVPDVAYEVTLPDGSLRSGRLGSDGRLRFDQIDPGQCQIRFPEIDGREWHPA